MGAVYGAANFGTADVDWWEGVVALSLRMRRARWCAHERQALPTSVRLNLPARCHSASAKVKSDKLSRIFQMGIAAMSEGTPGRLLDMPWGIPALFDEARLGGQPWNQEATLDGLLI
jgi:hypothetical protein